MRKLIFMLFSVILLGACGTAKNVVYLQDTAANMTVMKDKGRYITIQPKDMLYILVSSKDPELAMPFNLPRIQPAMNVQNTNIQQNDIMGYTVNSDGCIDFPILGKLEIAGLNREEIELLVKTTLIERDLIKDPVVTVTFSNLTFSVMGEVSRPGQYTIDKDQISIMEALSRAGDLTILGNRQVMLVRETQEERTTYNLDLCSSQIYNSPAYYVQQNDMIYVAPNKARANQSTVSGNSLRSVPVWISIASFLTSIGVMVFN